ncbi:MAG: hypothetical protein EHM77_09090, partial [Planctomycetaceae bacterium]
MVTRNPRSSWLVWSIVATLFGWLLGAIPVALSVARADQPARLGEDDYYPIRSIVVAAAKTDSRA